MSPNVYGVRINVTLYIYAQSYNSWNVNSRGFQLYIKVKGA